MASRVRPHSAADRTRRYRLHLFSILIFGVLLSGGTTTPAAALTDALFEQYDIVTGAAKHQTVLPGFFLGGASAELVVVHIDENDDRRVRIVQVRRRCLGGGAQRNVASRSVVRRRGQHRGSRPA